MRIAFVSTYPPRRCGIAMFTSDLARRSAIARSSALHPARPHRGLPVRGPSPDPRATSRPTTSRAARALDRCRSTPSRSSTSTGSGAATTASTSSTSSGRLASRRSPPCIRSCARRRRTSGAVLVELVAATDATVVMSGSAASLLEEAYGVDAARIDVIPHGVPDLPLVDPDTLKPALGLDGREVILSFGLLGPGKGYEHAIAAMPAVVAALPDAQLRHPRRDPPGSAPPRGRGVPRLA